MKRPIKRLVIACGCVRTLGALIEHDRVRRFFFATVRGEEEAAAEPQFGDIVLGRLRTLVKGAKSGFVDIGASEDGFVNLGKDDQALTEGAKVIARVKRPAIGAKGALLTTDWRKGMADDAIAAIEATALNAAPPQRLSAREDAAVQVHALCSFLSGGALDDVVVDDRAAAQALAAAGVAKVELVADGDLFETMGASEALEAALERTAPIKGGGRIVFDETEAGAFIDIDAGGAFDGGAKGPARAVNEAAASDLFAALETRAIGGRIVVDFLTPGSAAERRALLAILEPGARAAGAKLGKLAPDGLLDLTIPRRERSLLERASEPVAALGPERLARPARRFRVVWLASEALEALERALRRAPSARIRLRLSGELYEYVKARPQWTQQLAARYGARFEIDCNEEWETRNYDVAE